MALYALSAVYFAGVMVRLMLTLTPVVCVLAGIAFSILLDLVLREDEVTAPPVENEESKNLYDKVCCSGTFIDFMLILDVLLLHYKFPDHVINMASLIWS